MRAVVVNEFGPIASHKVEEFDAPVPGKGEVLIDVHAIGLNYPDILMLQGKYQSKPDRPFVPGRDVAGIVSAVGEGVTRVKPGDRVAAPLRLGGYAEQAVGPEMRVYKIPDNLDFIPAAGMVTIYMTAYVGLMTRGQYGQYRPNENVLVLGASGGVGLAAIQIAKAKGATVIAGVSSPEKGELAKASGADFTIDVTVDNLRDGLRDQIFAVTDNYGVDIVLDPLGGDYFDAAIRAMALGGRIVVIGFASGRIADAKTNYFNIKNLTMAGLSLDQHFIFAPGIADAAAIDVFGMYEKGQLKPEITATYEMEDFATALARFENRSVTGKMVMTTGR
jgi:NADPH:quinone reductase